MARGRAVDDVEEPAAAEESVEEPAVAEEPAAAHGLPRALGLTLASAFVWGVAHLSAGRRLTGGLLVGTFVLLAAAGAVTAVGYSRNLAQFAVRPDWLAGFAIALLVLGLIWVTVVLWSYQVVRPTAATLRTRAAGRAVVALLCVLVAAPLVWGARSTYVYRDALTSIFQPTGSSGRHRPVDQKDPWAGQRRVNILLLGGDAAANRTGVRTDSVTLASIDTRTGHTVLLSLPRNLESFPMPPGPARHRFPYGFTGDGPLNPGLLNEVYEYADNHPEVVPGVPENRRGAELMKGTVSEILGQPIDYYILVDMFGFADIIDAMGGVKIKIEHPIPYGQRGEILQPGNRKLNGKEALWYGRSRNDSDDYARMSRQKCLLRAVAKQADPQRVLTRFERLASATKRTISTDIPQDLLPALIDLSGKVKDGAQIDSLQFVPPLIRTGNPDFALIRKLSAKAIADSEAAASPSPSATGSPAGTADPSPSSGTGRSSSGSPSPGENASRTADSAHATPMSLDAACPS
jgi:anionic cell wall polymer biosynthesis LytR-Cps2A-Psr (LCP) family protein